MALGFAWQLLRPQGFDLCALVDGLGGVLERGSSRPAWRSDSRGTPESSGLRPASRWLTDLGGVLERGSSPPRALHGARIREAHQSPQDSGVSSLIQIAR